jgi:shikimate kinase
MTATFRTSQAVSVDSTRPHFVLVGLPGSGKTTVGEAASLTLGRPFLDLDREIERRQGMTVAQIFAERGEYQFRQYEQKLTEELRTLGGMILSPGGGWIASPENVALLRPPARIIYLRVRPETALKRMGPERSTRPMLFRPDPLVELRKLLEARRKAYEGADQTVDTEYLTVPEVTNKVCELVRRDTGA